MVCVKKSSRRLNHPPHCPHLCFRSGTEAPQKTAPVKPAWKQNCCNLWTVLHCLENCMNTAKSLKQRWGKKNKTISDTAVLIVTKLLHGDQVCGSHRSASGPGGLSLFPNPPLQPRCHLMCPDLCPPRLPHPPIRSLPVLSFPAGWARNWMWQVFASTAPDGWTQTQGRQRDTR